MANSSDIITKKIESWKEITSAKGADIRFDFNSNHELVLKLALTVYRIIGNSSKERTFLEICKTDFANAFIEYMEILGLEHDFVANTPNGKKTIQGLHLSERDSNYITSKMEDINLSFNFYFPSKKIIPYDSVLSGVSYHNCEIGEDYNKFSGIAVTTIQSPSAYNNDMSNLTKEEMEEYVSIEQQMARFANIIENELPNFMRDDNNNKIIRCKTNDIYIDNEMNKKVYGDNFQKICTSNNIQVESQNFLKKEMEEIPTSPKPRKTHTTSNATQARQLSEDELEARNLKESIQTMSSQISNYIDSLSSLTSDDAGLLKFSAEDHLNQVSPSLFSPETGMLRADVNLQDAYNVLQELLDKLKQELSFIKNIVITEKRHIDDVIRERPMLIVRDLHEELISRMTNFESLYGDVTNEGEVSLSEAPKILNALSKVKSMVSFIDQIKQNSYISEIYPYNA